VTLAGAELDKAGLLLDFKDLKDVMKYAIDRLDHQMINDIEAGGPHLRRVYLSVNRWQRNNWGAPLLALFEKWPHPTVDTRVAGWRTLRATPEIRFPPERSQQLV
jgi:6-pyruvoyl-tetrahydropterin synthase